ncbi:hypothetical protein JCM5353_007569 [Sporobolomyces roseus]
MLGKIRNARFQDANIATVQRITDIVKNGIYKKWSEKGFTQPDPNGTQHKWLRTWFSHFESFVKEEIPHLGVFASDGEISFVTEDLEEIEQNLKAPVAATDATRFTAPLVPLPTGLPCIVSRLGRQDKENSASYGSIMALLLLLKSQHCVFTLVSEKRDQDIAKHEKEQKAEAFKRFKELKRAVLKSWETVGMSGQASLHRELHALLTYLQQGVKEYKKGCYTLLIEVLKGNLKWHENREAERPLPFLPQITEAILHLRHILHSPQLLPLDKSQSSSSHVSRSLSHLSSRKRAIYDF